MSGRNSRADAIAAAAVPVFSRYGFTRTSMADIAAGAGVSRATLYLHFKDKEAVFRYGCEALHAQALAAADTGFAGEGTIEARLGRGLSAFLVTLMTPVMHSPHGQELFDVSKSVAGEIFVTHRALMLDKVTRVIAAEGIAVAEAVEIAAVVLAAAEGIKGTAPDLAAIEAGIVRLASLLVIRR